MRYNSKEYGLSRKPLLGLGKSAQLIYLQRRSSFLWMTSQVAEVNSDALFF